MLLSVALILLCGMGMSWICKKLKLPGLLGMLLTGIVLGPYVLNLLDENLLNISSELRKMALIIILMRAGLGLDISGLKKIGRPAVMMCFVPASFELLGMLVLAPRLLGLSVLEAAILGSVLAAVSPAVVVPRMVRLMEEGYGTEKGIPQLILAGASVDDVYVIVLFTTFSGIMQGKSVSVMSFLNIPISIILGMIIGLLAGWLLARYFEKVHIRDTVKVLILLSISFLLVVAEDHMTTAITFSALIAVMFLGVGLQKYREVAAKRIAVKCGKMWVAAEVFLFVLVGATVNIGYRVCLADGQLIAPHIQLHRVPQRGDLSDVDLHSLGDPHIHNAALHGSLAVELSHDDGVSHLGVFQRFHPFSPPQIIIRLAMVLSTATRLSFT